MKRTTKSDSTLLKDKLLTRRVTDFATPFMRMLTYAVIGMVIGACASTNAGREKRNATPCPECPVCKTSCPQSDCSRTLGPEERTTSAAARAEYFKADGKILFVENLTGAQCRVVPIVGVPEITPPCPANKPHLCGIPPNTFCSAVKYPGCT